MSTAAAEAGADADAGAEAGAEAGGASDAGADADGDGVAPPPHAATTNVSAATRVSGRASEYFVIKRFSS